jgi:hypothetical protein
MARSDKPIRISGHARDQLTFRGGSKEEVTEAIRQNRGGQLISDG